MLYKVPDRLKENDRIAILSPSDGLAELFPWVYELGLKRLKEEFKLDCIEFPTAKKSSQYLKQNPQARAEDINNAFTSDSIRGIIATIGGDDQICILPFLNKEIIKKNPKIFLGYSDNSSLHLYLWELDIVSYYGGNLMTQFAMQTMMHEFTKTSIQSALFKPEIGMIHPAEEWTDTDLEWGDPENLNKSRPLMINEGWIWHNPQNNIVKGRLWGGCLETLKTHLLTMQYIPSLDRLEGAIFFVETSEEMPSDEEVYRFFSQLAKTGLLQKFKAILVGRPKSQFCGKIPSEGRELYASNQRSNIIKALKDASCEIPVIFNMDFGHTDPQLIIPSGGLATIDSLNRTIQFSYS